ncbi:SUMF1/EgtB/PvdO family nonheme iron enzyme [Chondromyces apiculatus]|uniref:Cell division protein FtsK n=1 Tax=Chondromyces apiculatus DSM 436 TaxID=1192034 RepID=A0A017SZ14_9BACT|nr:SUMF1/EgtB/PvdO family nonheme iron enzyme [Chondromyces apiculatus]EYF01526.1 Cell division protein FtsK [Chondromyces apiculatus DSM 436]
MRSAERLGPALLALAAALSGCQCGPEPGPASDAGTDAGSASDAGGDGSDSNELADAALVEEPLPPPPPPPERRCPPEMVRVARSFCVDRYEATLVDVDTGAALSPYYPPSRRHATSIEKLWQTQRLEMGNEEAQAMPLPPLPAHQRQREVEPRAVSRGNVVPQGYTSGEKAALACKNAGKRLCAIEEWRTACMGEQAQQFPYGPKFQGGKCNVFRETHPALVLHDDMTRGHSDPRLNQVRHKGRPLLRRTGETSTCMSTWEGDAVADMVGNLDEWVADDEGTFVGGFYARSTRDGCMSAVTAHTFDYFDYSTGIRCCMDLPGAEGSAPPGGSAPGTWSPLPPPGPPPGSSPGGTSSPVLPGPGGPGTSGPLSPAGQPPAGK